MQKISFLSLFFVLSWTTTFAQIEKDSLKMVRLEKELESIKSQNDRLSGSLEITNMAINDLVKDKKVSDETKYLALKSSILHSATVYKKLSDDIINLKSRMTDEDYQGFIKSLSSIQGGPLGFSFEEVIIEATKKHGFFETKSKMDRFLEITNNILASPISGGIPFVSQAVFASNSLLNIAYGSIMTEKKPDFEKIKKFESELNRYLAYYNALDKANMALQSSNNDRIVMLENLQGEMINKIKKEAPKLGFSIPERNTTETMDAYCNRVLNIFSKDNLEVYLNKVEAKHRVNREVNYGNLLGQETDLKYYVNHIYTLADLSKKFINYYDNFFDIADNYQMKIIEAVNLANKNGIIKGKKTNGVEENPAQVFERINYHLRDKKVARDNGIKDSINISDLKQKIEKIDEFRII
jgi:hypothetical protein